MKVVNNLEATRPPEKDIEDYKLRIHPYSGWAVQIWRPARGKEDWEEARWENQPAAFWFTKLKEAETDLARLRDLQLPYRFRVRQVHEFRMEYVLK